MAQEDSSLETRAFDCIADLMDVRSGGTLLRACTYLVQVDLNRVDETHRAYGCQKWWYTFTWLHLLFQIKVGLSVPTESQ